MTDRTAANRDAVETRAVAPTPARIPGQPGPIARYERTIIGTASVILFMAFWEFIAQIRLMPELFLPGPSDIWRAYLVLLKTNTLGRDIWVSGQELLVGYGLAIVVGLPFGLLMAWYKRIGFALDPFVSFFFATPRTAMFPLFLIWFGLGLGSKVAIVFLGAFFPIVINTIAGVRNLDPALIRMARSFSARDWDLFRDIVLPGSVPFILSGCRLGLGHALISVVVGEMIGAEAGIGLMMANAGSVFQTARVFVGIIIVAGAGVILTLVLQKIEARFQSWKPQP